MKKLAMDSYLLFDEKALEKFRKLSKREKNSDYVNIGDFDKKWPALYEKIVVEKVRMIKIADGVKSESKVEKFLINLLINYPPNSYLSDLADHWSPNAYSKDDSDIFFVKDPKKVNDVRKFPANHDFQIRVGRYIYWRESDNIYLTLQDSKERRIQFILPTDENNFHRIYVKVLKADSTSPNHVICFEYRLDDGNVKVFFDKGFRNLVQIFKKKAFKVDEKMFLARKMKEYREMHRLVLLSPEVDVQWVPIIEICT